MNFTSYITQKINSLRKPNKLSLALFLGLLVSPLTHAGNIIFDGDGVLFDTREFHAAKEIGLLNIISFGKNPRPFFMDFLDSIEPRSEQTPLTYDAKNNLVPQLMCDWMTGSKTPAQIINQINSAVQENDLLTRKEKNIIKAMSEFIFGDPECYINTKKLLHDGKKFVKRCKKKGHKVFILSNWDSASFPVLKKKFSKFFDLFDGVVISGDVGMLKPDPAIYSAIIEKFNLDPQETVFIDDRPENIAAAQEQGLYGILCDKDNFRDVRREFLAWEGQHDEQQIV
ncbi:MAG: HAD-IA family hydrolase [Candidatus Dependentiae bacterium]|nr:HAD-IA family hydrolase [Candidatus Dependentiae bacterium]